MWQNNCNYFHNILRLFDVLPNFPSTTNEKSVIIRIKYGIYELTHELFSDIRLRILENWKGSGKSQNFIKL